MRLYLQYFYAFILIALLTPSVQAATEEPAAAGAGAAAPVRVSDRPMPPTAVLSGGGITSEDPIRAMGQHILSIADAYLDYLQNMEEFVCENVSDFLRSSGYIKSTEPIGYSDDVIQNSLKSIIKGDVLVWKGLKYHMEEVVKDPKKPSIEYAGQILSLISAENTKLTMQKKGFETYVAKNKLQEIFVHIQEDQEQATGLLLEKLLALMPPAYQADYKKYRPLYISSSDQHGGGKEYIQNATLCGVPVVDITFPNGYKCRIPDQLERPNLSMIPILDGSAGLKADGARLGESAFCIALPSGVEFMVRQFPTLALERTIDETYKRLRGKEVPRRTLSEIYPGYIPTAPAMAEVAEDEVEFVVVAKEKGTGKGKARKGKKGKGKPKGKVKAALAMADAAAEDSSEEDEADDAAPTAGTGGAAASAAEVAPAIPAAVIAESVVLKETTLRLAAMPAGKYEPLPARPAPKPHVELTDVQQVMLANIVSMTKVHNYRWIDLVHLVNAMGGKSIGAINSGIFEFQRPTGSVHIKTYYPHATSGNVNMYTVKSLMRGLAKIGLDKDTLRAMSAS